MPATVGNLQQVMQREIKTQELRDFLEWYFVNFDKNETSKSVLTTCMCGHFHICTKEANIQLKRCFLNGFVKGAGQGRVAPTFPLPARDPWWVKWEKKVAKHPVHG